MVVVLALDGSRITPLVACVHAETTAPACVLDVAGPQVSTRYGGGLASAIGNWILTIHVPRFLPAMVQGPQPAALLAHLQRSWMRHPGSAVQDLIETV